MTKDRRLGRGLAALLGTPIEESQIIDSTANELSTASTPSQPRSRAVAEQPATAALMAGMTAGTGTDTNRMINATANSRTSVTGAVPLAKLSEPASTASTLELKIDEIDSNPFQPRRDFREEELASLAASLREHQQLQPVLVRKVGGRYQLISGERRLRAAAVAGLKTVRAEVRQADDRLVAELAIVENLQRKDLNPIEKAMSFKRYIDQHACTQDDLAKRLKIDRSTIANLMRLLELPEEILQMIQSEKLSAGHARALLPLGEVSQQLDFAGRILAETWSVRETEQRVTEQLAAEDGKLPTLAKPPKKRTASPQIVTMEQELRAVMGTKTQIVESARGRGKIIIHFSSTQEFDRLRNLLSPAMRKSAA